MKNNFVHDIIYYSASSNNSLVNNINLCHNTFCSHVIFGTLTLKVCTECP